MPLDIGTKLGPYEIIEAVGAGGMGEVYKARDTRLEREVAIKILNIRIADNPDLKARFEREAKAISSLNHPNICTLYDVGSHEGTEYLVMEYIEGESLAERLKNGPLPLPETLSIATQIADALDKAHRQGLIHRDLKPGNIMLTREGAKLLDFGLAKLQVEGGAAGLDSITQTTPLTGAGTLIGTMQYMAPEQLEGAPADQRSDIFAFGVVLYEMATGIRAFKGNSQASLIASILKEVPRSVSEVLPLVPPMLEQTIDQCLAKDPEQRWQSAADLKRALQWISEGKVGARPGIIPRNRSVRETIIFFALILFFAASVVLTYLYLSEPAPEQGVAKFVVSQPSGLTSMQWPKISPDGTMLAFVGTDSSGTRQVWIRPINSLDAYPLKGTEGVSRPFWSPDSRQLAYFTGGQLKKIPATGGPAQLICETSGADGSWGSSNIIIFDDNVGDSIRQVAASGGVATPATFLKKGESLHAWPCFLPDGEHFLYMAGIDSLAGTQENYMLRVTSLDGSVNKDLFRLGSRVDYAPEGYILYVQDRTLVARRFDPNKLELLGDPVPLAENVARSGQRANFSVSSDGRLSYQRGQVSELSLILRLNRQGEVIDTILSPGQYRDLELSPDGRKLAYEVQDTKNNSSDIWVRDLTRGVSSRLTFGDASESFPIWSPDNTKIMYSSNEAGQFVLKTRQANGLGDEAEFLSVPSAHVAPGYWSPVDGFVYFTSTKGSLDIGRVNAEDTTQVENLLVVPEIAETYPQPCPTGRYLAYCSAETGESQVYILDMSGTGGKWQVSANGGYAPKWRRDGKELFFRRNRTDVMAVPISTEDGALTIGTPVKLFEIALNRTGFVIYRYDVAADGQSFIVNTPFASGTDVSAEFVTVFNWNAEIETQ